MPDSATAVKDDECLRSLLQLALPKPAHIAASDGGGAALALALHCLMVREGFTTVLEPGQAQDRGRCSSYAPPPGWAGRFKDEWVFMYSKDGCASRFILHCSLQVASKRMLISVSEESNAVNNEHFLGLQLQNYVPDPACLKSNDWAGVVVQAQKMSELFQAYATGPLLARAEELPPAVHVQPSTSVLFSDRSGGSSTHAGWLAGDADGALARQRQHYLMAAAVGAAALGVAIGVALYFRSSPGSTPSGGSHALQQQPGARPAVLSALPAQTSGGRH